MNIPNILTIFRLILIPIYISIFFSNIPNSLAYSIGVFLIAGFTDFLDGYIARRYKLVTRIGIVLDPLADKLMLITVLTCLVIKKYIPIGVLIIVTSKELFMIFCGLFLYKKGTVIPSNIYGKATTIFFYISILFLAFNKSIGVKLLYIAVIFAIIALVNYAVIYFSKNKNKNNKVDDTNSPTL